MRLVMKAQMGRLIFIPIPPMDEYPWQTTTAVVGIRFQSEVVGISSSIGRDQNKNGTSQFIKDKNNSAAVYARSSLTVHNPFLFTQ